MHYTRTPSLGRSTIEDEPEDVDEAGNFEMTGPGGESPTDAWFVISGVDHGDNLVQLCIPNSDGNNLILATNNKVQHQSESESLKDLNVNGTAQIQEGLDEPRPGSHMIHPKLNGVLT